MKIKILKKIVAKKEAQDGAAVMTSVRLEHKAPTSPPRTPKQPAKPAAPVSTFASPFRLKFRTPQRPAAPASPAYLSLDQQNKALRAEIDELRRQLQKLETTHKQSILATTDQASNIENLTQKITTLQNALDSKTAAMEKEKAAVLASLQETHTIQLNQTALQHATEKDSLQKQIQALEEQKTELKRTFDAQIESITSYRAGLEMTQIRAQNLVQKQIQSLTSNHKLAISALNTELEKTRLALSERDAELAQLSAKQATGLEEATCKLQAEHAAKSEALTAASQQKIDSLTAQLAPIAEKLEKANNKLAAQDIKTASLLQQIEELRAQLAETSAKLDITKENLAASQAKATTHETENTELKAEAATRQAITNPDDLVLNLEKQKEIIGCMVILSANQLAVQTLDDADDPRSTEESQNQQILEYLQQFFPNVTTEEIANIKDAAKQSAEGE
ncbi:hypothetical protein HOG75_00945 [bacterium]|nr:hypothetical protein [bacterium]